MLNYIYISRNSPFLLMATIAMTTAIKATVPTTAGAMMNTISVDAVFFLLSPEPDTVTANYRKELRLL